MREKIEHVDYVGFTFNGLHSSQLGIVRTSDGSRFNENLLPTIQDKTLQVPGGDGTYYLGSFYTQRPFSISFAFDDLTEQEFTELKVWLGDKKVHDLVFDELPYKAYQAKVTGSATIKHIPFEEGGQRVYKGEGSIQFTAYQPYAKSTVKFLDQIDVANELEWAEASGLLDQNIIEGAAFDTFYASGPLFRIYNPGDIETHFQMFLKFEEGMIPKFSITLSEYPERAMMFGNFERLGEDTHICIDTKLNIIEGLKITKDEEGKIVKTEKTGNIYNKHMKAGSFFKIPVSREALTIMFGDMAESNTINDKYEPKIRYDFYYF